MAAKPALAEFLADPAPTCAAHLEANGDPSDNVLRYYCTASTTTSVAVRMKFSTDSGMAGATTTIYDTAGTFHDFDLWGLSAGTQYYFQFEDINATTTTADDFTVGDLPVEIWDPLDTVDTDDNGMNWIVGAQTDDSTLDYVVYDHAVCDGSSDEDYLLVLENDRIADTVEVVWYEKNFGAAYTPGAVQAFDVDYDDDENPRFHVITADRAWVKTVRMNGTVLNRLNYSSTCSDATSTDGPCVHHAVFPSTLDGERRWFIARARAKRASTAYPYRNDTYFDNPEGCGTGTSTSTDCDPDGEETYFAVDGVEIREQTAPPGNGTWAQEYAWELDKDTQFDPDECNGGDLGLRNTENPMECGFFWDDLMTDATGDEVYDYSHLNSIWHDGGQYVYATSPYYAAIAKYLVYDVVAGVHVVHDPPELVEVIHAYDDTEPESEFKIPFSGTGESAFTYDLGHHLMGLDGAAGNKFTIFDNFGNKCFSRGVEIEIADWDTGAAGDEWKITDYWDMDLSGYLGTECSYVTSSGLQTQPTTQLGQNCMTHGSVYEIDAGGNVLLSCGRVDATDRGVGNDAQGAIMEFDRGNGDVEFSISPVCDNLEVHNPYRAVPLHSVVGGSPRF